MGRQAPFGSVVTGFTLPTGYYDLEIKELNEQFSREKGLLMYVAESRVVAPGAARGKAFTEYFVIGKSPWSVRPDMDEDDREWALKDDPEAEDPETWIRSSHFKRLKALLEAAQFDLDDVADMDVLCDQIKGLRYGARIVETVDTNPRSNFHGREINQVKTYYAVGRHEAAIDDAPSGGTTPKAKKPSTPARPRSFDDDDE